LDGKLVDREVGSHTAGAYAVLVRRRLLGVDAAEELAVAPDMADCVDARRAVLAAPMHFFRGEGKLVAILEGATGVAVRGGQRERIGRVHRGHRRLDFPRVAKIDQACVPQCADQCARAPRIAGGAGSCASETECRQGGGKAGASEGLELEGFLHLLSFSPTWPRQAA